MFNKEEEGAADECNQFSPMGQPRQSLHMRLQNKEEVKEVEQHTSSSVTC